MKEHRDPELTRKMIIEAAKSLIADHDEKDVSVLRVARVAGINRGTAYLHFADREELIEAVVKQVSEEITSGIFGARDNADKESWGDIEAVDGLRQMARFFVRNPSLVHVWISHVLLKGKVQEDPLWSHWVHATKQFAVSEYSQTGIDAELLAIAVMGMFFLWPLYIDAQSLDEKDKATAAERLVREALRLSLFGAAKPEKFSEISRIIANKIA